MSFLSWNRRGIQNLERSRLVFSKFIYRNLTSFDLSTQSLKNFHFSRLLLSKVYIVWAKIVQRSFLSWNQRGIQNLERNRLVFSKFIYRNLTSFDLSTQSLKNFHFSRLLLSKVYIVWAKIVQRSFLSWNQRGIQNLKRNRLVVSKLTYRNLTNFVLNTQTSQKVSL